MKISINSLTSEEKLKLLTGKNCWENEDFNGKLPSVFLSDGPSGLRKHQADYSETDTTAYPTLSSIANSWSKTAAYEDGAAIADDCIEFGADVLLAPGVNIKRTPLCGRNFEYFSEDPYLAGTLAHEYIKGVQDKGIGTSLKHFAGNNREVYRLNQNSEIDNRSLHEIYLKAFQIALEAKPWTVMCSYNLLNGVYASENKKLLTDILRGEFKYDGALISDWSAVKHRARALKAGCDLEMPHTDYAYENLKKAYELRYITDEEINRSVQRILDLIEKSENAKEKRKITLSKSERHNKAASLAEECFVLLKNEDNLLPIKKDAKALDFFRTTDNVFIGGGGSSDVKTKFKIKSLCEALKDKLPKTKFNDFYFTSDRDFYGDYQFVCVGNEKSVESEGFDRVSLRLSDVSENLILNTAKNNPNTVVVLYTGGAVDMTPWIDKVKAVIQAGFSGEGVNEALAKVITGEISPSGKLSETYPLHIEDTPTGTNIGDGLSETYREGIYVGYRYYEKYNIQTLFPFGYGLSYAAFIYSDLKINKISELNYKISYRITNVSETDAKEVSQIYIRDNLCSSSRPEKELKGFDKTLIKAGETKLITVNLDKDAFAYYNESLNDWYVENGRFTVLVGSSSDNIRLKGFIDIELPEYTQQTPFNEYLK